MKINLEKLKRTVEVAKEHSVEIVLGTVAVAGIILARAYYSKQNEEIEEFPEPVKEREYGLDEYLGSGGMWLLLVPETDEGQYTMQQISDDLLGGKYEKL